MARTGRVAGPSHRVVVVGAGLGGLACAMHLAGTGREVTVLERAPLPGGRAGRLELDGFTFDTGPTVLTMPDLVAEAFAAVGEDMADWLQLDRVEPAYRAWYPDGTHLDVIADPERMAAEIARVCGPREADGYRRFAAYARRLWHLQRHDFIDRNLDSPRDLLTANLLRLLASGGFGRLQARVDRYLRDPRTRRVFSFQAMYAGLDPHRALALYCVIAYLDAISGVHFPRGGIHQLPQAMARAATKHGVRIHYDTEVTQIQTRAGRATAVLTGDGQRIPADVVVVNADLPGALDLVAAPAPRRRLTFAPSCVVVHIGATQAYAGAAHHNIHFGRSWRGTFDEVIRRGRLMSDPSLLVTNPTRSDPSLAPPGAHTYYVLAPVPNLQRAPIDWHGAAGERYADQLVDTLESRGYLGLRASTSVRAVYTPASWADQGLAAGTPFGPAHTLTQTGPFRPANLHPAVENLVFVGSGTQPGVGIPMVLISGKLAAARVAGPLPPSWHPTD